MSVNRRHLSSLLFLLLLTPLGCKKADPGSQPAAQAPPKAAISEADRKEAADLFAGRCTLCHGAQGAGDGPASAGLTPRPRNLRDRAWQTGVTDEHIEKIITYGGAAVGKSPAMPPNPDLNSKPGVVAALREHIRSLAKK